jgi:hypothetical protein
VLRYLLIIVLCIAYISINIFPELLGFRMSIVRNFNNNSVALGHERIMPTEQPRLVGEDGANFCRIECATDPEGGFDPYGSSLGFLYWSRYFFFQVVDPVLDPLLLRKSGSTGNRNQDLWICSQELWPLDHRGGLLSST